MDQVPGLSLLPTLGTFIHLVTLVVALFSTGENGGLANHYKKKM